MVSLPQVAIPHVIGTAVIIGLIGIVALYSSNIEYSIFVEATRSELNDIVNYVASEIISMYGVVSVSVDNQTICKELNIPDDVNGKGYSIKIVNDSGLLKIVAFLDENPSINASSVLPTYNETYLFTPGTTVWVDSTSITVVSRLYSGIYKPVIVINKMGNYIYLGLGELRVA